MQGGPEETPRLLSYTLPPPATVPATVSGISGASGGGG